MLTTIRRTARLTVTGLVATAATVAMALPSSASTGTVAYHRSGAVECGTFPSRNVSVAQPAMYAVNRTTAVDSQWVAYKPVLYKYTSSGWSYVTEDGWMRGVARDNASPTRWIDEGGQAHIPPTAFAMQVSSPGYYRVAIRYYWYATGSAGAGSDFLWATTHNGGSTTNYCYVR
jgi:hypothetical protein